MPLLVTLTPICHPRSVRLGVLVVLVSLVLAAPAAAHSGGAFWSVVKVMDAVDEKRISVGTKVVRVSAATTLCSGEGRGWLRRGVRRWMHFRCTFTTFTARGLGPDIEFRVHALDPRRIAITNASWVVG